MKEQHPHLQLMDNEPIRRTIHGVTYNTRTAHLIGGAAHGEFISDFTSWRAALYRTQRSGRYFLAGYGGPMTMFAQRDSDGSLTFGERIVPLETDDATRWCRHFIDPQRTGDAQHDPESGLPWTALPPEW